MLKVHNNDNNNSNNNNVIIRKAFVNPHIRAGAHGDHAEAEQVYSSRSLRGSLKYIHGALLFVVLITNICHGFSATNSSHSPRSVH